MRIGILTLPLHNNYGGILQAYALMTSLKKQGHEVWLIKYDPNKPFSSWKMPIAIAKRMLLKYILGKEIVILKEKKVRRDNQSIQEFIDQHIQPQTHKLYESHTLHELGRYNFDACIVGSDQVWREKYNPKSITNYFFDFISSNNTKKISYAASFGVDSWDYDRDTTEKLKVLAEKFDALSVREDSGVRLCKEFLNIDAELVLDPTMLLDKSDYEQLATSKLSGQKNLLTYILDETTQKKAIIEAISDSGKFNTVSIGHSKQDVPNPSIINWLEGFSSAQFVVTDSFHGCVFSIIFNIPFIVIGNDERGLARFNSLLRLFTLENRLVTNENNLKLIASEQIDWNAVNAILIAQKAKALTFLNNALTK
ncbi:polysaccharide pyruvyl transferase family protein [Dyadobacter sp. LJ53]|uniref:polysaccharide pyruvyl transferase family protein n=1 Tax=Dyadobacter chenwenxiniae TaxID=2906456 RepID=UPI001F344AE6|nr:polysaccharide pyruvyl transferase family protein [Dyadobacter chenwenxiniae]MCF0048438.1 polysaccharide pyruvyl transferase family protein [Dyadobacter chenwenxiniae]